MQMELDGKKFYESQAADQNDKQLMEILLILAEEEQKHYNYFRTLKENESQSTDKPVEFQKSNLSNIKNIFVQLSEMGKQVEFGNENQEIWREAMRIEEKAEKFYREKANEETDEQRKRLLNRIADEEHNHIHMIDGVLAFLKYPDTFAQTSQFKDFQSLEGH